MARTGWGRHTVVATGSNDNTKQISVNAWNNDLDTDGLLGFTKQAGTISGGAIVPTGSVIEVQADGTLSTLTPTNNNEFDLLYLIAKSTATSVTIDHDASGGAGKIRLLSGGDETLSTTTPMILMCRTISSNKEWVQYGGGIVNALNDIGDVVITSVANEDVLAYDSTTSKWINQSADESGRVTATSTNTFENKTVDLADNTLTGSVAEFNTALQSESFATLGGTETLVSKTLTSPVVNTQITGTAILDSDTMSGASATTLATSESIKAYVDTEVATIPVGDITAVTAGTALTGGGASGDVTVNADVGIGSDKLLQANANVADDDFLRIDGTKVEGRNATEVRSDLSLVASATTDTTNADNISSGTLAAGRVATLNQDTTGNADTATALETARTIGGVSFDGTANINLPGVNAAGTQNTSGTAAGLSATLAVASGGTNLTSYTAGDLLYATGATTLAKLAKGTASQQIRMNSGATAPEWFTPTGGSDTPWTEVHNFADYYYDMEVQTKPSDPAADHGRFYVKEIDSNNDGVFCIIRKNGGFEETQIV